MSFFIKIQMSTQGKLKINTFHVILEFQLFDGIDPKNWLKISQRYSSIEITALHSLSFQL